MTEIAASYHIPDNNAPKTLAAFKNRKCARPFHLGYTPPDHAEVTALIALAGWTQTDLAKLVGVSYHIKKGSSTVRRWKTGDPANFKQVNYATWRLMLLYAGVVSLDEGIIALQQEPERAVIE